MPKAENPNIGERKCLTCDGTAYVRQFKNRVKLAEEYGGRARYARKLYLVCPNGCGQVRTENQALIRQGATFYDGHDPDQAQPATPPVETLPPPAGDDVLPEPPAEPTPEPAPAKKSWADEWLY